ncbi:hypothetical protein ACI2JA_08705 [Alkalihalobacillus sp. NPDC078783]
MRIMAWFGRCVGMACLFGFIYFVVFFIDQSSWNPGRWNDKTIGWIKDAVPDTWFVDQLAFFTVYEFNVLITTIGLGMIIGIASDFLYTVVLKREGSTE